MKKSKQKTKQEIADRKARLSKFFGAIKLQEDPLVLQRMWRDEWK